MEVDQAWNKSGMLASSLWWPLPIFCHIYVKMLPKSGMLAAPAHVSIGGAPMHSAGIWFDLAAHARAVADSLGEPALQRAMLDIAADYEILASGTVSWAEPARYSGGLPCRGW